LSGFCCWIFFLNCIKLGLKGKNQLISQMGLFHIVWI
jgi:hypothetical protein